jgi:hypothetical protein
MADQKLAPTLREHTLFSYSSLYKSDATVILGFGSQGRLVPPVLVLEAELYKALNSKYKDNSVKDVLVEDARKSRSYSEYLKVNSQLRYMGVFPKVGPKFESLCPLFWDLEQQLKVSRFLDQLNDILGNRLFRLNLGNVLYESLLTASQRVYPLKEKDMAKKIQEYYVPVPNYLRLGKQLEDLSSGAIPWNNTTCIFEASDLRNKIRAAEQNHKIQKVPKKAQEKTQMKARGRSLSRLKSIEERRPVKTARELALDEIPSLFQACLRGDKSAVERNIRDGYSINMISNGITPLFTMVLRLSNLNRANYLAIIKLLLEKEAKVNVKNKLGRTAIEYCEDAEVAELLLRNGAVVNFERPESSPEDTILERACRLHNAKLTTVLLQYGAQEWTGRASATYFVQLFKNYKVFVGKEQTKVGQVNYNNFTQNKGEIS